MAADRRLSSRSTRITPSQWHLQAGEFSLHHTLARHRSAPNRAAHRRIGLGISYIPAYVRTTGSHRLFAMLVRGQDRGGHFDLLPAPRAEFDPAALALHEQVYQRYRQNYAEQIEMHERQFADDRAVEDKSAANKVVVPLRMKS